tara:strand:+ start:526 stop:2205 length:1680 start_codon:yes stop_codon:yes gene_type:complete
MSAVADLIEDAFDAVGDVFEAVGDVVEDVVDFVGDAIEKVGDVVQAVLDDPLPVLLSVAGSFIGIPPFVTMGAVTAARGGDLEDIVLSMGTAYFAPQAGNFISSTVSSTFIEAGFNEAFTQVASDSISKGLVNGVIAEVKGGSFEDGFAGGFTGGLVSGGVGEVASYVQEDIVQLALDSGLDLNDANAVFKAGVKAVSAGVTSEVTGRGDFVTSFTNSAIGSGVDAGTRTLNTTIDQQFNTAATGWNDTSDDGDTVDTTVVGGGIPDSLVTEVKVSDTGVDNTAITSTFDTASVLNDTTSTGATVSNAVSDDAVLSDTTANTTGTTADTTADTVVAQAPTGQTTSDFQDLITTTGVASDDNVLANTSVNVSDDVVDIAESLPEEVVTEIAPTGALASVSDTAKPVELSDIATQGATVVSEAPVSENLLVSGLAQEQPVGGLNAVLTAPKDEATSSLSVKPTDITKPVVATVGNLLKSSLTQKKRPATARPAGALQAVSTRPKMSAPPAKMDVAKLIPIQKAVPVKKPTTVAPAKTLASTANLSPVSNIAGLTSLVKKTG